jgi:hypothetical protein
MAFLTKAVASVARQLEPGGGHCRELMEKWRRLIKVPPIEGVFDVSGVAALNSISANAILHSTCRLLGQWKGESYCSVSVVGTAQSWYSQS